MAKPEIFSSFEKLQQAQLKFNEIEEDLKAANGKWETIATAIDDMNDH
jgi:hypothetical protein